MLSSSLKHGAKYPFLAVLKKQIPFPSLHPGPPQFANVPVAHSSSCPSSHQSQLIGQSERVLQGIFPSISTMNVLLQPGGDRSPISGGQTGFVGLCKYICCIRVVSKKIYLIAGMGMAMVPNEWQLKLQCPQTLTAPVCSLLPQMKV